MKRKAAYLQIIRKCNNECVFCSNPQFEKEIGLKEAIAEIEKLKKEGVNEIFLTGGEPTISKDLFQIIQFLKRSKIEPRLITNGVELSSLSMVKKLRQEGLRSIYVSLHAHDEAIADKLAQRKGHFKQAIMGIKNVLGLDIQVNINCTINAMNYGSLPDFVSFINTVFPAIEHFVFNFLDPGRADGNLQSRAHENPGIVVDYAKIQEPLKDMVDILKRHKKTFRIERVPLCAMQGFEEYSTETRKIVKDELYICSFIEEKDNNKIRKINPCQLRVKPNLCTNCSLKQICAGVQKEYLDIHGEAGLKPSDKDPQQIIEKISIN